jgi:hypothetical protein
LRHKAATPLAHCYGMHVQQAGDLLVFSSPSAHANTIRARCASACAVFGREAIVRSYDASASVSVSTSNRRPGMSAFPAHSTKKGWQVRPNRPKRFIRIPAMTHP